MGDDDDDDDDDKWTLSTPAIHLWTQGKLHLRELSKPAVAYLKLERKNTVLSWTCLAICETRVYSTDHVTCL